MYSASVCTDFPSSISSIVMILISNLKNELIKFNESFCFSYPNRLPLQIKVEKKYPALITKDFLRVKYELENKMPVPKAGRDTFLCNEDAYSVTTSDEPLPFTLLATIVSVEVE